MGIKTDAATVEGSMELPQKLKTPTALKPSDFTLGMNHWVYIQINPKHSFKKYMYPYVHCSAIYNSQDLEAAQMPIGG